MTKKLYWTDQYMKEFSAKVERANGNEVVLDQTAFYPGGGGQPNDVGTIEINGATASVTALRSDGSDIIHILDKTLPAKPGDDVTGRINWDVRYAHMRYHTTLHIIDNIAERRHNGKPTGNQIYPDRARVDFDMPNLTKELAATIIGEANDVVGQSIEVRARELSREEALRVPDLVRTEPGRELVNKLDRVRVVEIVGFDTQSDGGTHVANTKEIGRISLSKFDNKGAHHKRIEITLS